MAKAHFNKLRPWFILNHEASSITRGVLDQWAQLLESDAATEDTYHRFLADHAGLFFGDSVRRIPVVSELRLGSDYRVDFVVMTDEMSYGLRYELIELEIPHVQPYTKASDPRSRFTHAIQRIRNWRRWIEENRSESKLLFPSKLYSTYGEPNFSFTIVIGRRTEPSKVLAERNRLAIDIGIRVRSFDALTDFLTDRPYTAYTSLEWQQWSPSDYRLLNEVANPFYKAYDHSTWRKIVRSPSLSTAHMLVNNAKLLVSHRQYSKQLGDFDRIWRGLAPEKRASSAEDMRRMAW